jgi:hypothetical protein
MVNGAGGTVTNCMDKNVPIAQKKQENKNTMNVATGYASLLEVGIVYEGCNVRKNVVPHIF